MDQLTFKDVTQCIAIVYDRPCKNVAIKSKLCVEHKKLKALHCNKYHFIGKSYDVEDHILCLVELHSRINFETIYRCEPDEGHEFWKRRLMQTINIETRQQINYDEDDESVVDELIKEHPESNIDRDFHWFLTVKDFKELEYLNLRHNLKE